MTYSAARVLTVTALGPRLIRIEFEVADTDRLAPPGRADDAVGIYLPRPGEKDTPPMELRDGVWGYFDLDPVPEGRNYTVRYLDPTTARMTVDVVVHARGPATQWARHAAPGDVVAMAHARGWYRPAPDTQWQLLVADLAGLPALARILDELPGDVPVTAIVEVAERSDLDYLPCPPAVDLVPLVGGNGYGPSGLAAAVRSVDLPAGRGYCWLAAEASESRAVRKYLRGECRWHRDQYDIIGYWRYDGEEWSRRYAGYGDDLLAVYRKALADGKSEKQASEEFDEALERVGL
ncbi:siderophore-interacting protein [Gordonia sinesedis]